MRRLPHSSWNDSGSNAGRELNRSTFIAAIAPTLVGISDAVGTTETVERVASSIDGTVAVFAQRLNEHKPSVAINATESFPAASIIKLVILLTVYKAIDAGRLHLDTRVSFRAGDIVGGSETFESAREGQTASVHALVRAMVQQSDNSASNALVGYFGFETINKVAQRVGLRDTHLRRLFLHSAQFGQNVTTAADIGALLLDVERGARGGMRQSFASVKSCQEMVVIMLGQEDRGKIVRGLPSTIAVANKTGELPQIRHDAAIIDPLGAEPYILVVLEKGLRNQTQGVVGINRISRAVYRLYQNYSPR